MSPSSPTEPSELRCRSLIALAFDGVLISSRDGVIVEVNEQMCAIAGRPRGELVGGRVGEVLFTPESLRRSPLRFDLLERGETVTSERIIRRPDGTEVIVETRTGMTTDGTCQSFFRDVTGHKRIEEALRESEERYRLLVQETSEGINLVDEDGRIVVWNRRLAELTGIPAAEALGELQWDVMFRLLPPEGRTPERYAQLRRGVEASLRTGEPPFLGAREIRSRKADGSAVIFEQTVFPIRTVKGFKFGAFNRDITSRKQTEEALRESEQLLRATFEHMYDGILVLDVAERRFIMANGAMCRMIGCSHEEFLRLGIEDIHPPADLPAVAAVVERQLRGEMTLAPNIPVRRRDGSVFFADINSTPTELRGHPCLIGVFRDMTEKRRMLEHTLQAQKLESLGVLAGGIAHDFNNLLAGIFGYLELVRIAREPAEISGYLQQAIRAIDRARGLTGQLLTFAKGGTPTKRTEALQPFLEEATRFALSGSSISCGFSIPGDLWRCSFDRNQLAQVVDNLVRNARQSMPLGGSIAVTAHNVPCGRREHAALDQGRHVAVTIVDTGVGIPKEVLPRIFDPFFSTKEQGHGLGLATCHSIISQHGGAIAVSSEPGRGSRFTVFLPAVDPEGSAPSPAAAVTHRGTGRLLIMDDEELVRDVLRALLVSLGYDAVATRDGAEAIARFEEARGEGRAFDAVFLDLTVPGGMGGLEAAARLRALDAAVPIFMASGYANAPVVAEPGRHGFSGSISKPFTREELVALLERHLSADARHG